MERIAKQRQQVSERLRRLGLAFADGLFPDEEYRRQKRTLEMELESLVVSEASAAEGAAGSFLTSLNCGPGPAWRRDGGSC